MADTNSSTTLRPFQFQALPAELRVKIYRYSFLDEKVIAVRYPHGDLQFGDHRHKYDVALLRTCKLIYHEAFDVFYHENVFRIELAPQYDFRTPQSNNNFDFLCFARHLEIFVCGAAIRPLGHVILRRSRSVRHVDRRDFEKVAGLLSGGINLRSLTIVFGAYFMDCHEQTYKNMLLGLESIRVKGNIRVYDFVSSAPASRPHIYRCLDVVKTLMEGEHSIEVFLPSDYLVVNL